MINHDQSVRDVFVIGASAGGLKVLIEILGSLPPTFRATIGIVLHRSPTFESQLDKILGRRASLPVLEPADGAPIQRGHVYIAPRDVHLSVRDDHWRLTRERKMHGTARPLIRCSYRPRRGTKIGS